MDILIAGASRAGPIPARARWSGQEMAVSVEVRACASAAVLTVASQVLGELTGLESAIFVEFDRAAKLIGVAADAVDARVARRIKLLQRTSG